MVVVWTALSFTVVSSKVPSGVPRRLVAPLAWDSASLHHWTVIKVKPSCMKSITPFLGLVVLEVNEIISTAGYGQGFSNTHFSSFYSCHNDSRALLL